MNKIKRIEQIINQIFRSTILNEEAKNEIKIAIAEFSQIKHLREIRNRIDPVTDPIRYVFIQELTNSIDLKIASRILKNASGELAFEENKQTAIQEWTDFLRFAHDKDSDIREHAVAIINIRLNGAPFPNVIDKKLVWDELIRLTRDDDSFVRWHATREIGAAFFYVPDKKLAWDDLHQLTQSTDSFVREGITGAIGDAFSHIPDKESAWNDLNLLTRDADSFVRVSAYHSLGKASIFMATNAENYNGLKKKIEEAILYFEKSSQQDTPSEKAKFCLPFYRSFYAIAFKKEDADIEAKKYIVKAKRAIESSKSKEKLLEAIDNLSNALSEVQKVRDFGGVKFDLDAYRRYLDRAAEILDEAEEKAPCATRLVRKGLPIIDERIKGKLSEIQEKAKALYKQVKDTEYKDIGQQANEVGQELSKVIDPIRLEKEVSHMLIPLTAICNKMPEEDRGEACEILKQIKAEQNVEDRLPLISMFLSKISTQMNKVINVGNITIENSKNVQVNVGMSKNSQPKPEKETVKKPALSIDEMIEENNASIEKILDNWGFKPMGYERDKKRADIKKWLHCFSLSEFGGAFQILEKIQYHDSHTVDGYMEGLSRELINVFEGDLSKILFYPLGESPASSGGNLLYSFRKNLGLTESSFPYIPFKNVDLSDKEAIVFFDDIIGSGNQAIAFANKHLNYIKIDKYYVALMAFEKGLERVKKNGCFKKVIVHEIISEELRAFSPNSQVFPDADTKEQIKRLCEKYGKFLYPKHPLGYDDSQGLIVFPHNTPNNTLPIIWASDKNEKEPGYVWYPVWERIKRSEKKIK